MISVGLQLLCTSCSVPGLLPPDGRASNDVAVPIIFTRCPFCTFTLLSSPTHQNSWSLFLSPSQPFFCPCSPFLFSFPFRLTFMVSETLPSSFLFYFSPFFPFFSPQPPLMPLPSSLGTFALRLPIMLTNHHSLLLSFSSSISFFGDFPFFPSASHPRATGRIGLPASGKVR